jgi:hypothetical protein
MKHYSSVRQLSSFRIKILYHTHLEMYHLQVLVLILRLRQACLHPVLTTTVLAATTTENQNEDTYRRRASRMKNTVIQRLIQQELDEETAEVCFPFSGCAMAFTYPSNNSLVSHLHGCHWFSVFDYSLRS